MEFTEKATSMESHFQEARRADVEFMRTFQVSWSPWSMDVVNGHGVQWAWGLSTWIFRASAIRAFLKLVLCSQGWGNIDGWMVGKQSWRRSMQINALWSSFGGGVFSRYHGQIRKLLLQQLLSVRKTCILKWVYNILHCICRLKLFYAEALRGLKLFLRRSSVPVLNKQPLVNHNRHYNWVVFTNDQRWSLSAPVKISQ